MTWPTRSSPATRTRRQANFPRRSVGAHPDRPSTGAGRAASPGGSASAVRVPHGMIDTMRVLVVGGSGYVSSLMTPLLADRYTIRVLDPRPPSTEYGCEY